MRYAILPALVCAANAWAIGPVLLWSGEPIEPGQVASIGPQGIELRMSFEPGEPIDGRAFVRWGEVRDIEGGWGEAQGYRALAEAVHRAELRLARADTHGAGRALDPHQASYLRMTGATSSQIASAMIAVRLFDGDRVGATQAWFATLGESPVFERSWIDHGTRLCPALPPVFTRESGSAFLSVVDADRADATQDAMTRLYREAAGAASGEPIDRVQPAPRAKADPGVRFVIDMVRAQTEPDPTARRAARESLDRRGRAAGSGWQAAWAGLGVGVSMLGETDPAVRDAGAARLVSVLIELPDAAPGIAELTRDLLVDYFVSTGREGHADAVRSMERAALLGLRPWRDGSARTDINTGDDPVDEENP